MPPQGNPNQNRPKRVYTRGGSILRGVANELIGGISKGMYTRPQKKAEDSEKFSSEHFKKNQFMREEKAKKIAFKARASKDRKILTNLEIENQLYDPKRKKEPDYSWNEGNQTVARVRGIYGDKVADEVARKLQGAFGGKHTISSRVAEKHLMSIGRYGKDVREGINLIAKNFDQPFQSGPGANYITEAKLEKIIKSVAKTDKYAADSLKEKFMVTDKGQKGGRENKSKQSLARSVGARLFAGRGKRDSATTENTKDKSTATKENLSRSNLQPRENIRAQMDTPLSRSELEE